MSLPDRFNFSLPERGERWEKGGNRLVSELERMYQLLAFNVAGSGAVKEWLPTLVTPSEVEYTVQEGKQLNSPHYCELFFEMGYKGKKKGEEVALALPLERGKYISNLPPSGLIRGKVDETPFMASGRLDKEGERMEIWNITVRTPTPLVSGAEVYLQGTVKILRAI